MHHLHILCLVAHDFAITTVVHSCVCDWSEELQVEKAGRIACPACQLITDVGPLSVEDFQTGVNTCCPHVCDWCSCDVLDAFPPFFGHAASAYMRTKLQAQKYNSQICKGKEKPGMYVFVCTYAAMQTKALVRSMCVCGVCVCVCVHIRIYNASLTYMHSYINTYIFCLYDMCIYCKYTYIYANMHTYIYVICLYGAMQLKSFATYSRFCVINQDCTHVRHTRTNTWVYTCVYIPMGSPSLCDKCMHTFTYLHTYIHIHTLYRWNHCPHTGDPEWQSRFMW
jgi:hypothetical protein